MFAKKCYSWFCFKHKDIIRVAEYLDPENFAASKQICLVSIESGMCKRSLNRLSSK
ncbi:hypothetical protein [Wolbachia pipientis]|uniref:hypothetical protein n=1 Tax=Wolbachia pipientis TaxID=955 RepID=UPI000306E412|nr:hypothetical protein [Wolbachia pipientis]